MSDDPQRLVKGLDDLKAIIEDLGGQGEFYIMLADGQFRSSKTIQRDPVTGAWWMYNHIDDTKLGEQNPGWAPEMTAYHPALGMLLSLCTQNVAESVTYLQTVSLGASGIKIEKGVTAASGERDRRPRHDRSGKSNRLRRTRRSSPRRLWPAPLTGSGRRSTAGTAKSARRKTARFLNP